MDWQQITNDLLGAGLKQAHLARETGLKPPSIDDLKNGRQKTVKFEVGNALLSLHKRYCFKPKSA